MVREAGNDLESAVICFAENIYAPLDRMRTIRSGPYTFRIEGDIAEDMGALKGWVGLTMRF